MKYHLLLFLILLLSFSTLFAQNKDSIVSSKNELLTKRFIISAGIFVPSKITKVGVDNDTPNRIIDFEKSLGFDNQEAIFTFNFFWRFSKNKKWSATFEYFQANSSNQDFISSEVNWGDVTYPAGTELKGAFNFALYRVFFGRVISRGLKHELIGGIGLHALDFDTYLQGITYLDNLNVQPKDDYDYEKHNVGLIAPVPNIGFKYVYTPFKKWGIIGRVDWFSLNTSYYSGYLWNISASASYQLFKNFTVGGSYRYFNTVLDIKKRLWTGKVDLLYHGPVAFVTYNF